MYKSIKKIEELVLKSMSEADSFRTEITSRLDSIEKLLKKSQGLGLSSSSPKKEPMRNNKKVTSTTPPVVASSNRKSARSAALNNKFAPRPPSPSNSSFIKIVFSDDDEKKSIKKEAMSECSGTGMDNFEDNDFDDHGDDIGDDFMDHNEKMDAAKSNSGPSSSLKRGRPSKKPRKKAPSKKSEEEDEEEDEEEEEEEEVSSESEEDFDSLIPGKRKRGSCLNDPVQCEECGKTVSYRNLKKHQELHSEEALKYECDICQKKFRTEFLLGRHKTFHSQDRPHKCIIEGCDATFKLRQQLVIHMRVHSTKKEYYCLKCGKDYSHRSGLVRHIIGTHVKNFRPFYCSYCKKESQFSNHLKRHIEVVHKGIEGITIERNEDHGILRELNQFIWNSAKKNKNVSPNVNKCSHCSREYSAFSSLKRHLYTIHNIKAEECTEFLNYRPSDGEEDEEEDGDSSYLIDETTGEKIKVKNSTCYFCKKIFKNRLKLMKHVVTQHVREKKYKCSICDNILCNEAEVAKHIKYHPSRVNDIVIYEIDNDTEILPDLPDDILEMEEEGGGEGGGDGDEKAVKLQQPEFVDLEEEGGGGGQKNHTLILAEALEKAIGGGDIVIVDEYVEETSTIPASETQTITTE